MPDPGGGNDVAQIVAASGGAVAAVIGAIMLWPTRARRERAAAAAQVASDDPEDRPARLRERLTKVETRADEHERRIEGHDEEIAILRAQEVTAEADARHDARRRRRRDEP